MMRVEDFFFDSSFSNTKLFQEMARSLFVSVTSQVDARRPTVHAHDNRYIQFLTNQVPQEGRDWKDVFTEFTDMFQRAIIWQAPGAMINITPPANIPSLIASFCAALFNPNFATDESAGFLIATEIAVVSMLATLAGWDAEAASGVFTFGGKGTNLYALKAGLRKACPSVDECGIVAEEYVVFTNNKAHPCHKEIVAWLGLGTHCVISLKTTAEGTVDIQQFECLLREQLAAGKKVACIFLNGGTTNEGFIDPIEEIVQIRNRCVQDYNLSYTPHIHVDAVIGWVWLFFANYDASTNPLCLSENEMRMIRDNAQKISSIRLADSFGADFHKMGFCAYISSVFMVRDSAWLCGKKSCSPSVQIYGEHAPFEYTLELTRSSFGPVSAYIALEIFGVQGFQKLIYNIFHAGEIIRKTISKNSSFRLIHQEVHGFATMFVAIPPHMSNATKIDWNADNTLLILADYNHQFYLYVEKAYEEKRINTKITFSKSYKPYGAKQSMGALKIFPMSPIVTDEEWIQYVEQLLALKVSFDGVQQNLTDSVCRPEDLVWRD